MVGDEFGDDDIEVLGVESMHGGEEASCGFAEVAGGRESFDGGEEGRIGGRSEAEVAEAGGVDVVDLVDRVDFVDGFWRVHKVHRVHHVHKNNLGVWGVVLRELAGSGDISG